MTATHPAAAHPAGTTLRYPTCHRHRAVAMQVVRDATSTERRAG